ncbi:ribokinase [Ferrimonas balearica]|uniref:ribokinase n=1 Tax=Ferrimonas balearica TaxID=44012 RepID=UPI001C99D82E|nr:ribokinase [Ferrimonas balearica]MBY5922032.1 ribokinase [Ferrimonas balearica]MBY5994628.1 ribokinase [Ferrimonas balearica]
MATLTVLGSINVDHVAQVDHFPRPGETLTARQYDIVAGGKGANQAVAAARLGARTTLVGCVGEDAIGAEMVAQFQADGIDTTAIDEVVGHNTGLAMIYVDSQGENTIGIWPGANAALSPERVLAHHHCITDADLLLLQLETPVESLERAAELAREAGTTVVLNPAPARALPDSLLRHVDILTPNETEAEQLSGIAINTLEDADRAAQALHERFGIKTVIITLGKRGVWLSESGTGKSIPGFVVEAVDTTGAGDTFNGAMVTALLEGESMDKAIRFGQAAAALSVTRMGAQSSIPIRDEVMALLARQP